MHNKQDDYMLKLLKLSIDGIRKRCTEYTLVIDRNSNTTKTIAYNGDDAFVLASLLYKSINMSGLIINKIYYHQMNGMDIMVIGVLTGTRRPNQNIVLEAV